MSEENSKPQESSTKGQDEAAAATSATSKQSGTPELSLEELDAEIAKQDPLFLASLEEVKAIKPDGEVNIETYDAESELNVYFKQMRESRGFKKWLLRIFPFLPKLWKKIEVLSIRLKGAFLHVALVLVPQFLVLLKTLLMGGLKQIGGLVQTFKKKSTSQKVMFFVFILFVAGASYATWFLWVKKPLDHHTELFVNSIEEFADHAYRYDPKTELEPFYNNYRVSQNIITIPRMVMNIKASENSGPSPMAAIELYVEGGSPEVVVEIKDREAEMKDVMQRAVEEMNFDELIVPEGKQALSDRLRREVNRVLTKGKVRRIFLKSAVFKP